MNANTPSRSSADLTSERLEPAASDDRYWGPYRSKEQRLRTCGHKHDCGCGMANRGHVDSNYSRQGFCDGRCPECDRLDAEHIR